MKKLVVFGDSFANYNWVEEQTSHLSWTSILSANLNLPVINYGVSGSGLNYSMYKFFEYVHSENYDSNDIIVWLTTNEQRLYTTSMPDPHLGTFHNFPTNKITDLFNKDYKWIDENRQHALWAMENYYDPAINYSLLKIASFLKQWARSNKNTTIVLLKGQCCIKGGEKIHSFLDYITESDNFFPILNQEESLGRISGDEFVNFELYEYLLLKKTKHGPKVDLRVNHLSETNRAVLATQLTNIITHRSATHWNRTEYKKHIYSTKKDIDRIDKRFF